MTEDAELAKPPPADANVPALALHLLQTSYADYAATTQSLIARLTEQNRELRAELHAIRRDVADLMHEPSLPNPRRFVLATYPAPEQVAEIVEEIRKLEEAE